MDNFSSRMNLTFESTTAAAASSSSSSTSQQPLSLMTINANPNARKKSWSPSSASAAVGVRDEGENTNLLTIRVLESSERKMQLLKKLLTPEEYSSIPFELFSDSDVAVNQSGRDMPTDARRRRQTHAAISTQQDPMYHIRSVPPFRFDDNDHQQLGGNGGGAGSRLAGSKRFSRSETELKFSLGSSNRHENLARKREAIEFFFQEPAEVGMLQSAGKRGGADSLAIELRSGHYLSPSIEAEERLVKTSTELTLVDRLVGLLGFLGVSSWAPFSGPPPPSTVGGRVTMTSENEDEEFVQHHQRLNCEPYTRRRNLLTMKRRLEAEGQFDKIRRVMEREAVGQITAVGARNVVVGERRREERKYSNLLDRMAKMDGKNRHSSKDWQQNFQQQVAKTIQSVGHFQTFHLVAAKQFRKMMTTGHSLMAAQLLLEMEEPSLVSASGNHAGGHPKRRQEFKSAQKSRIDDSSGARQLESHGGRLVLSLISLKLKTHRLMLDEHKLVIKMLDGQRRLQRLRASFDRVAHRLVESVEAYIRSPVDSIELRTKIKEAFELRHQWANQLDAWQQELLAQAMELDSLRREQGFNSTSLRVTPPTPTKQQAGQTAGSGSNQTYLPDTLIERFVQAVSNKCLGEDSSEVSGNQRLSDFRRMFEQEKRVRDAAAWRLEIEEFGLEITPDSKCPQEEFQRRRTLASWLSSLTITLLIGEQYYHRCTIDREQQQQQKPASSAELSSTLSLDLRQNQLVIPTADEPTGQLWLRVEVHSASQASKLNPLQWFGCAGGRQTLLASAEFKVATAPAETSGGGSGNSVVELRSIELVDSLISGGDNANGGDAVKAELEFFSSLQNGQFNDGPSKQPRHSRYRSERLVDSLYKKAFTLCHPLDDTATKLAKLLNRIEPRFLLEEIKLSSHSKSRKVRFAQKRAKKSYFALDSFVESFCSPSNFLPGTVEQRKDVDIKESAGANLRQQQQQSLRQALLVWRWLNNLSQTVHLSERENAKHFGLESEELKSRLASMIGTRPEPTGYKLIEQTRLKAAEYIRQFEAELEETLRFNAEVGAGGSGPPPQGIRVRDLLREPQFSAIDMSGAWRVARRLVPRPTARRPLMPQRRAQRKWGSHTLSYQAAAEGATEASRRGVSHLDLEGQAFLAEWGQRFAASGRRWSANNSLQLVVTIQQATNVPMRVIQQQPQQPAAGTTRPNSPFVQSASSPTMMAIMAGAAAGSMQLGNSPQQQATNYYLSPPTTYVETVFQRKQQASSLALGKNPSWNETLFFPVSLSPSPGVGGGSEGTEPMGAYRTTQLVDEFLQINLYDYHCYTQESPNDPMDQPAVTMPLVSMSSPSSPTTLDEQELLSMGATGHDSAAMMIRANRMLATRQRVERHLLGSLRIPLTTLLSSGRIEGSFALNQPLFLDNYQFEPSEQAATASTSASPLERRMMAAASDDSSSAAAAMRHSAGANLETHMSLFITLDPQLTIPTHLYLALGSHESERVFEYAKLWEQVVMQHWRHAARSSRTAAEGRGDRMAARAARRRGFGGESRHVRALVLQRSAKYCLASRLLGPLKPPAELVQQQQQLGGQLDQMRSVARFVALLSPLKYGFLNMRLLASSLWFDSGQLLNQSLGGPEEKAILLCNYFLHLGKCAGLLLGDAIPEGRCVYVIVWHEQSRFIDEQLQLQVGTLLLDSMPGGAPTAVFDGTGAAMSPPVDQTNFITRLPVLVSAKSVQLWDPNSGKAYQLTDQLPLVSVGSIVTLENVYANVQSVDSPADTNYDLRLRQLWFPLFGASSNKTTAATTAGNLAMHTLARSFRDADRTARISWRRQLLRLEELRVAVGRPAFGRMLATEPIRYEKLDDAECDELKGAIESAIKAQLLKWRPDRPTYFNRTMSRLIADKLALFEARLVSESSTANGDGGWRFELAELIRNEVLVAHLASTTSGLNARQVISWPVNLPFTSIRTILDGLFASGVHNADLTLDSSQSSSSGAAQYLVACHVHAYPARVVSVWLYVAAVVQSSRGTVSSQRFLQQPTHSER